MSTGFRAVTTKMHMLAATSVMMLNNHTLDLPQADLRACPVCGKIAPLISFSVV
jgi:hypothetical protein